MPALQTLLIRLAERLTEMENYQTHDGMCSAYSLECCS